MRKIKQTIILLLLIATVFTSCGVSKHASDVNVGKCKCPKL